MATVVNNDGGTNGNGMGNLLAVVLFIVVIIGLLYFGLPLLRGGNGASAPSTPNVNVNTK